MYVETRKTVPANVEAIWAHLSDFAHPDMVYSNVGVSTGDGVGVGSYCNVTVGGLAIRELCVHFDPVQHVLSYTVNSSDPNVYDYVSTVRISYLSASSSEIHWSSHFKFVDGIEPAIAQNYSSMIIEAYETCIVDLERAALAVG